ncbi:hypothetical protein N0V91_000794 [Didymella pomorum]|uniref:Ribonuclease H2 subunit B n=1 Tax=Didymella pomorum TaxID=749634 RepID=A0A9W9DBL4_9PLEO|nr:hypothetical protein N0V91_000794 [Didymella pomorum]
MARATRAKPGPKEPTPEPAPSSTKPLPEATSNPPKLFILPKDTSNDARIVTLDDPATNTPSRYYFCPSKGFYEFTRIAAPKKACRSWLITRCDAPTTRDGSKNEPDGDKETEPEAERGLGSGFVTKDASLLLATPIDLLFLILPALAPKSLKEEKQHFLELDDYTDKLGASSRHWKTLLAQHPSLKGMVEKKMRVICDTVDAGEETMYRLSHAKLLAVLMKKAERMVKNGLPPSMEDKFIKTALEVPIMSIRREESTLSAVSDSGTSTPAADSQTTSESQATDLTTPDEVDLPAKPTLQTPDGIPHLLRLRTALTYLTSSYLPPTLATSITSSLSTSTTPSFAPLTAHLSTIAQLKSEAAALRSISDNISRKRAFEVDEDKIAEREEKKRKKEEEAIKKKNESLGVKKLRKVDTSGMKKMSAFFSVKPKAK